MKGGIVIGCVLASMVTTYAETIVIEGSYLLRMKKANQEEETRDDLERFKVWFDEENRWGIQLSKSTESDSYITFDGEAIRRVYYDKNARDVKAVAKGDRDVRYTGRQHLATIATDGYPFDAVYKEKLLWFAFLSSDFLNKQPLLDDFPALWLPARFNPNAYDYAASLVYDESGQSVRSATFSKSDRRFGSHDSLMRYEEIDYEFDPNQFDKVWHDYELANQMLTNGFIWASYKGTSFTNTHGRSFPTAFHLQYFEEPGAVVETDSWLEGSVHSVTRANDLGFQPPIYGVLRVLDRRHRVRTATKAVDFVSYSITNGMTWNEKTEEALIGEVRLRKGGEGLERWDSSFLVRHRAKFAIVVAIVILGLPFLLAAIRRKRE